MSLIFFDQNRSGVEAYDREHKSSERSYFTHERSAGLGIFLFKVRVHFALLLDFTILEVGRPDLQINTVLEVHIASKSSDCLWFLIALNILLAIFKFLSLNWAYETRQIRDIEMPADCSLCHIGTRDVYERWHCGK